VRPEDGGAGRTALVLGATGLVGAELLEMLLADPGYARVEVLARRPPERRHPRLRDHAVDFERLSEHRALLAGDDLFCCLGTTMARAGSEQAFRRVDLEYVVQAAELAVEQGVRQFVVISSVGADPQSRILYNRTKGEMEAAVKRLPFQAVWILRPSLLLGDRAEHRRGERMAAVLSRAIAPLLIGALRRYRPIPARAVAAAMLRVARRDGTGGVLESDQIAAVAADAA
jgi:uncharacterized protein YbjT (DUF2867 family)